MNRPGPSMSGGRVTTDAGAIREDQGQPDQEGSQQQGSEADSGGDVQQEPEAGTEAGDGEAPEVDNAPPDEATEGAEEPADANEDEPQPDSTPADPGSEPSAGP